MKKFSHRRKLMFFFRTLITLFCFVYVGRFTNLPYFFPLSGTLSAAPPLVLESGQEQFPLGLHSDFLEDTSGSLTIDDVRSPEVAARFTPATSEFPNFGLTESTYWFRLKIRNPQKRERQMKLLQHSDYLSFSLYIFTADGRQKKFISKNLSDLVDKKRPRRELLVSEIDFEPAETLTVFIRINSLTSLHANLSLWETESLRDFFRGETYFLGMAWGIVSLFAGLNFLFFLSTRKRLYLHYAFFLSSFLFYRMQINLWDTLYLSPFASANNHLTILAISGLMIFGILFFQELLEFAKKSPQLHRISNGWLVLNLLLLVFPYVIGIQNTLNVLFFSWLPMIYLFWVGVPLYWREGLLSSRLNLLAGVILFVSAIIHILRTWGLFPSNLSTVYVLEIGIVFESLIHFAALEAGFKEALMEKEIAQKHALNNLRRADEVKDRLLANTSHELRTPLHGMIGLTENILSASREKLSEQTTGQLKLLIDNGLRLSRLVGNLLDLSALQGRKIELHSESVVLHTLADAVLKLAQPLAGEKTLRCVNQVSPDLPPVSADPNRLQQILINLTANAVKYTHSGNVIISAHQQKDKVRVEVRDTGSGIPPEQLETIFESFRRGENPEVSRQEGLGLGLGICRELVEAHASRLDISSVVGEGSVFSFELPVSGEKNGSIPTNKKPKPLLSAEIKFQKSLPHKAPATSKAELTNTKGATKKKAHILAVDDDFTNLEIVFGYLGDEYRVTCCNSGQEALNTLEQDSSIRLVLLDVMMPELDGFDVCELIREKHPAEELPVLLLTALAGEEDITQGYQSGANDYLTKPFRKAELSARIAAQLRLSGFHRGELPAPDSAEKNTRKIMVETLQMSLDIWEEETAKTLADLALKSKIWGTHLESKTGTYRSRGLQNYLSEVSLPAHPRWRKVAQTAQFVIQHCPEKSASRKKLSEQLDLLTDSLQK